MVQLLKSQQSAKFATQNADRVQVLTGSSVLPATLRETFTSEEVIIMKIVVEEGALPDSTDRHSLLTDLRWGSADLATLLARNAWDHLQPNVLSVLKMRSFSFGQTTQIMYPVFASTVLMTTKKTTVMIKAEFVMFRENLSS